MKTNKGKTIKIALFWAAVLLIGSLVLKSIHIKDLNVGFLIIVVAAYASLNLSGTNNLSCNTENKNTKS